MACTFITLQMSVGSIGLRPSATEPTQSRFVIRQQRHHRHLPAAILSSFRVLPARDRSSSFGRIYKQYMCLYCNRIIHQTSHLKPHLRSHLGVRPFRCKLCSHSAVRRNDLIRHLRGVHQLADNPMDYVERLAEDLSTSGDTAATAAVSSSGPILPITGHE